MDQQVCRKLSTPRHLREGYVIRVVELSPEALESLKRA